MAIQHSITGSSTNHAHSRTLQADLVAFWNVLKRGWKLVLLGLVLSCTLASIYLAKTKRAYQASTRLLVIQHGGRPLSVTNHNDLSRIGEAAEDPVPTHAALISSPLVIEQAIRTLDEKKRPSLNKTPDPVEAATLNLRVSRPDRLTKMLLLDYRSPSREESLAMIESIVASYKKLLEDNYQRNNKEVISLVSKARDELKTELDALQEEYQAFRKNHPGLAIGASGQSLISRRLEQWSQGVNDSTDAMIQLKARLDLIKKMEGGGAQGNAIALAMNQFGNLNGNNGSSPTNGNLASGSYEQLQKELSAVEIRRRTAERLLANLKANHETAEEKVTEEHVAGEFKTDVYVAELYRELKRAQVRYNNAKRATHNANDPSLKYSRERKEELEAEIEDLWRQRRPVIQRQLTREMSDEFDLAIQKAETELSALEAEEKSLLETLKEAKQEKLVALQEAHERLVKLHGADAPETIEAKKEVERATSQMEGVGKHAIQSDIHDMITSIEHSLKSIGTMRTEYETKLSEDLVSAKQSDLERLEEERLRGNLDRQTALYNTVLDQLKQAVLVSDYSSISCQVVDPPHTLPYPVQPRIKMTLALALLGGVLLGMGFAMLADIFDSRIRTLDEVRRVLDFPLIGTVPKLPIDQNQLLGELGLISHVMPRSIWAEAYRSVRTSLEFLRRSRQVQVILITSAHSGDGKTTTASNMAISFALAGRKVLLVDADLRKPALHKILGLKGELGLSHVLRQVLPLSRVVQSTQTENLDFIASGTDVENPAELLASSRLTDLVSELRGIYDLVIFDSSPLLAVTDPSIISAVVDGVILVVQPEATKRDDAMRTAELLKTMDSPVLGFIVNGMDRQRAGAGYGYGYGYGYGTYGRIPEALEAVTPAPREIIAAANSSKPTNGVSQGVLKD